MNVFDHPEFQQATFADLRAPAIYRYVEHPDEDIYLYAHDIDGSVCIVSLLQGKVVAQPSAGNVPVYIAADADLHVYWSVAQKELRQGREINVVARPV